MNDQVEAEQWAFETFAGCYPQEAYGQDPVRFCEFVRSKGCNITDKQIVELLNEDNPT